MSPKFLWSLLLSASGAACLGNNLKVTLDYGTYVGYTNNTSGFNVWKSVRYAAPPTRWQAPKWPSGNSTDIFTATTDPPQCPQSMLSIGPYVPTITSARYSGDEDCLFLNIYTPSSADDLLPVMFYIHGGGYGTGSASSYDFTFMSELMDDGFMFVVLQYRLGAFGFASSTSISQHGIANAGLYDQYHALEWVQKYISSFGGDPNNVTIAGESAGGGSVALQAMAYGGTDGTRLWQNGVVSSPYIPQQWDYDGAWPTKYYNLLADFAGCADGEDVSSSEETFQCLSTVDSDTLQNASAQVSARALFGQWAFVPVTDGTFVQERPTVQLLSGKVNGQSLVIGQNANEGYEFVHQNISSKANLTNYLSYNYPLLSESNLAAIMDVYSLDSNWSVTYPLGLSGPFSGMFDSNGLSPPYATNMSKAAGGWQQATDNLYAEVTMVCPAYWLAAAYSPAINPNAEGKKAWRYQFSPPNAFHAVDLGPLQKPPVYVVGSSEDAAFRAAFQGIWGSMIVRGDPTLASGYLDKVKVSYITADNITAAQSEYWQPWGQGTGPVDGAGDGKYALLDLNVTAANAASFRVADGMLWEGGRGARCDLWAELGAYIPA